MEMQGCMGRGQSVRTLVRAHVCVRTRRCESPVATWPVRFQAARPCARNHRRAPPLPHVHRAPGPIAAKASQRGCLSSLQTLSVLCRRAGSRLRGLACGGPHSVAIRAICNMQHAVQHATPIVSTLCTIRSRRTNPESLYPCHQRPYATPEPVGAQVGA